MKSNLPPAKSQPIEYATPSSNRRRRHPVVWSIAGSAVVLVLISFSLLPTCIHPRESSNRLRCASNLREIGQAIILYGNDNQGQYPDTLVTIYLNEDVGGESTFVCPSSNDMTASGPTTQAIASNLSVHGHCSYIYLGKGLSQKTVTPTIVLAYEPLADHMGAGMNVLFGDGHVEFIPAVSAGDILKQANNGTWPVVYPISPASHR